MPLFLFGSFSFKKEKSDTSHFLHSRTSCPSVIKSTQTSEWGPKEDKSRDVFIIIIIIVILHEIIRLRVWSIRHILD